jgi:hypothetical protein
MPTRAMRDLSQVNCPVLNQRQAEKPCRKLFGDMGISLLRGFQAS